MYLTIEERKLAAETTVRAVNGRCPVFVHVGAWNLSATIELAQHARSIGADGIGVVTPSFFKISDDGLFEFYRAVAKSVPDDYPVYMYAIPQCSVNDITPALAQRVAEACPNVVGIKYSYPNMSRIQQMLSIRGNTFSVLCGPDELFDALMCIGGDGTVSGNSQCIPEHYVAIYQALKDKDLEKAALIQRRTNQLNDVLCEYDNIAHYKAVLEAQGIISTRRMRKPMTELSDEATRRLMEKLESMNYHQVIG